MRDMAGCRRRLCAMAVALAALPAVFGGSAAQAEEGAYSDRGVIDVGLDQAKLVRLEEPAAEIIIGNPSIADISVQNAQLLVVTGKSFGRTNMIVVNAAGEVIEESDLTVGDPSRGMITVHRGARNNETVYCAPKCTAPLAIGDNSEYFGRVQEQISAKQSMAEGRAGPAGSR